MLADLPVEGGIVLGGKANAILITPVDDVVTTIAELRSGETGRYVKNGQIIEVVTQADIPRYHKVAVRDITRGELVRKYGEVIGIATQDISKGSHVHEHNIASAGENPQDEGD